AARRPEAGSRCPSGSSSGSPPHPPLPRLPPSLRSAAPPSPPAAVRRPSSPSPPSDATRSRSRARRGRRSSSSTVSRARARRRAPPARPTGASTSSSTAASTRSFAPEKGSGDAQLKVRGFTERNAPEPALLVELKPVETALDDYEQRSWWLEVKERRRVILEAAGRNLADLRLWTNGSWLVDAEPAREVVAAQPGRPMLVCRLAADLNPGLYLLTAYGGASQPQAEESAEHPLHLRFGIPRL